MTVRKTTVISTTIPPLHHVPGGSFEIELSLSLTKQSGAVPRGTNSLWCLVLMMQCEFGASGYTYLPSMTISVRGGRGGNKSSATDFNSRLAHSCTLHLQIAILFLLNMIFFVDIFDKIKSSFNDVTLSIFFIKSQNQYAEWLTWSLLDMLEGISNKL